MGIFIGVSYFTEGHLTAKMPSSSESQPVIPSTVSSNSTPTVPSITTPVVPSTTTPAPCLEEQIETKTTGYK